MESFSMLRATRPSKIVLYLLVTSLSLLGLAFVPYVHLLAVGPKTYSGPITRYGAELKDGTRIPLYLAAIMKDSGHISDFRVLPPPSEYLVNPEPYVNRPLISTLLIVTIILGIILLILRCCCHSRHSSSTAAPLPPPSALQGQRCCKDASTQAELPHPPSSSQDQASPGSGNATVACTTSAAASAPPSLPPTATNQSLSPPSVAVSKTNTRREAPFVKPLPSSCLIVLFLILPLLVTFLALVFWDSRCFLTFACITRPCVGAGCCECWECICPFILVLALALLVLLACCRCCCRKMASSGTVLIVHHDVVVENQRKEPSQPAGNQDQNTVAEDDASKLTGYMRQDLQMSTRRSEKRARIVERHARGIFEEEEPEELSWELRQLTLYQEENSDFRKRISGIDRDLKAAHRELDAANANSEKKDRSIESKDTMIDQLRNELEQQRTEASKQKEHCQAEQAKSKATIGRLSADLKDAESALWATKRQLETCKDRCSDREVQRDWERGENRVLGAQVRRLSKNACTCQKIFQATAAEGPIAVSAGEDQQGVPVAHNLALEQGGEHNNNGADGTLEQKDLRDQQVEDPARGIQAMDDPEVEVPIENAAAAEAEPAASPATGGVDVEDDKQASEDEETLEDITARLAARKIAIPRRRRGEASQPTPVPEPEPQSKGKHPAGDGENESEEEDDENMQFEDVPLEGLNSLIPGLSPEAAAAIQQPPPPPPPSATAPTSPHGQKRSASGDEIMQGNAFDDDEAFYNELYGPETQIPAVDTAGMDPFFPLEEPSAFPSNLEGPGFSDADFMIDYNEPLPGVEEFDPWTGTSAAGAQRGQQEEEHLQRQQEQYQQPPAPSPAQPSPAPVEPQEQEQPKFSLEPNHAFDFNAVGPASSFPAPSNPFQGIPPAPAEAQDQGQPKFSLGTNHAFDFNAVGPASSFPAPSNSFQIPPAPGRRGRPAMSEEDRIMRAMIRRQQAGQQPPPPPPPPPPPANPVEPPELMVGGEMATEEELTNLLLELAGEVSSDSDWDSESGDGGEK